MFCTTHQTGNSTGRIIISLTVVSALSAFDTIDVGLRAGPPRVVPAGKVPPDTRLGELRTLHGYFPFEPPSSEEWEAHAEQLRRRIRVALGLWPYPTKTPLEPVIHGERDLGEYTVAKVYFQSVPGHLVTGNLYRPKGREGKLPGVLCPHGHWPNGRFYDCGEEKLQKEIASGAEAFDPGGRSPLQSRCVQLARMGCVVFHYDMIGYADSVQISHRVDVRKEMNRTELGEWGLFSPQAELRLQGLAGLQTWNSMRALDFLLGLPDVDADRVGVTGASGGGTQTFLLTALDPRVRVAFPAVMVSTAMQGGCRCENANYLRIDAGNIEFAALAAPRPLAMTGADDWTKEIETKGFPELRILYARLGVPDRVKAVAFTQYGHNFNHPSRHVMYRWFNEHLELGVAEPIEEREYEYLARDALTVWTGDHPKPPGGPEHERRLLRWLTEDSDRQIDAVRPKSPALLERFREIVGGALDAMIGRPAPDSDHVGWLTQNRRGGEDPLVETRYLGLVGSFARGESTPVILLEPKNWNGRIVVWVDPEGKSALYSSDGSPTPHVRRILASGHGVAGVDLLHQGEFLANDEVREVARRNRRAPRDSPIASSAPRWPR